MHDDGDNDQRTDEHVEVEGRRPEQQQHVLNCEDERGSENDTEDRAAPAGEREPANHAGRNRLKLHAEAAA